MLGVTEWALKHGLHRQTVHGLLRRGRIEGARQEDGQWRIPENAPVPPMRVRRAPLVNAPEGMQSLSAWALEHGMSDDRALVIHRDAGTLTTVEGMRFVPRGPALTGMMTARAWAEREGLALVWVTQLARDGKLEGASKVGRSWMIPSALTGVKQRSKQQK